MFHSIDVVARSEISTPGPAPRAASQLHVLPTSFCPRSRALEHPNPQPAKTRPPSSADFRPPLVIDARAPAREIDPRSCSWGTEPRWLLAPRPPCAARGPAAVPFEYSPLRPRPVVHLTTREVRAGFGYSMPGEHLYAGPRAFCDPGHPRKILRPPFVHLQSSQACAFLLGE